MNHERKVNFAASQRETTPEKRSSFMASVEKFTPAEDHPYFAEDYTEYDHQTSPVSSPKKVPFYRLFHFSLMAENERVAI